MLNFKNHMVDRRSTEPHLNLWLWYWGRYLSHYWTTSNPDIITDLQLRDDRCFRAEIKLNEIQWSGRLLLFLPAVVEIISTVIVSTVTFAVVVVVVTIWPAIIRSISSVIVTVHADPWVPGNVGASSSSATTASRHVHLWNRDHQTWRQGKTWRHRQNMASLTKHDLTNLRSLI